jgi:prevent-host-death family protein
VVCMETIPITEAKARIAELADRVAREHDHFTITRNGRADVMLISVAEYESLQVLVSLSGCCAGVKIAVGVRWPLAGLGPRADWAFSRGAGGGRGRIGVAAR